MKKKICKQLKEIADKLPHVYEIVDTIEVKSGEDLNKMIEDKKQKEYNALKWHKKIVVQIKKHLAMLGFKKYKENDTLQFESQMHYKRKLKNYQFVNHYHKLKIAWKENCEEGVKNYINFTINAYNEQQKLFNSKN